MDRVVKFVTGCVLMAVSGRAQERAATAESVSLLPVAQTTVDAELRQMASQAGVIFAGQVVAIRPHVGWVEVEFRVDQAIRGCVGQAAYVLKEWSGLWTGGQQRYAVGQRLLMLLHAPGTSGLSSPVGGQDGMIPLVGTGVAPGPKDSYTASWEPVVDLRWVQARLPRPGPTSAPLSQAVATHRGVPDAEPDRAAGPRTRALRGTGLLPVSTSFEGTDRLALPTPVSAGVSLRSVLALLGAWETEAANARR